MRFWQGSHDTQNIWIERESLPNCRYCEQNHEAAKAKALPWIHGEAIPLCDEHMEEFSNIIGGVALYFKESEEYPKPSVLPRSLSHER